MSEPMTSETAHVIVVFRMADDLHHLLGRVAFALWWAASFLALALVVDLLRHDWHSAVMVGVGSLGLGLMGRDTLKRRRKYAALLKAQR